MLPKKLAEKTAASMDFEMNLMTAVLVIAISGTTAAVMQILR